MMSALHVMAWLQGVGKVEIIQILVAFGIFGYLIKIEHRISKVETYCKLRSGQCGDENIKNPDNSN